MAVLLSTALFETESATRRFHTVHEIKQAIARSKNYKLDGTDPEDALPLLLYQTRIQQTWLVKTRKRLYCLLDDIRKPEPHVNWSMSMDEVVDKGELRLQLKVLPPTSKSETSGTIDFGPKHKDWLFSIKLFTVRPVDEEIRAFLLK
jgi:hypothetical protein